MSENAISVGCKYCVNDIDEDDAAHILMRMPIGMNVMLRFYQRMK